jgi:hypothetical protein
MAVGTFTITSGSRVSLGSATQISGTVEAGSTAATAAILPNSYIHSFSLDSNVDGLATALPRVHINSSDFAGTVANGSVHIDTEVTGPETFNWTAVFI